MNAKSIAGPLMFAASQGSWIKIYASGEDEDAAVAAIERLITDRLGDDE